MGIMPHAYLADMKFFHKDLFHKIPRRHFRKTRRKRLQEAKIDPGLGQIKKLLLNAHEHDRSTKIKKYHFPVY